jgi:hypothetical protein
LALRGKSIGPLLGMSKKPVDYAHCLSEDFSIGHILSLTWLINIDIFGAFRDIWRLGHFCKIGLALVLWSHFASLQSPSKLLIVACSMKPIRFAKNKFIIYNKHRNLVNKLYKSTQVRKIYKKIYFIHKCENVPFFNGIWVKFIILKIYLSQFLYETVKVINIFIKYEFL